MSSERLERCRDAARKADEVLDRARRARNFIGATEGRTADAAEAARRAEGAVARAREALLSLVWDMPILKWFRLSKIKRQKWLLPIPVFFLVIPPKN